jgi:hypothetical protein
MEQFREVVVHARDAKVGFAVKRLAEVVNAVRVAIEKFDDGEDVLTAQKDGATELDDNDLLVRANSLGRVVFRQDIRFKALAEDWQRIDLPGPLGTGADVAILPVRDQTSALERAEMLEQLILQRLVGMGRKR